MHETARTVTYEELSYTIDDPSADYLDIVQEMEEEYHEHQERYDEFARTLDSVKVNPTNGRKIALWFVTSIKTSTSWLDGQTSKMVAGNFKTDKEVVEKSRDGRKKWELAHKWWNSDVVPDAIKWMELGMHDDAVAILAGLDPASGKRVRRNYLRVVKGSAVPEFLGFDRWCLDTRRYRAVKPLLKRMLVGAGNHPDTEGFRSTGKRQSADLVDRTSQEWFEDKLARNPAEYHAITAKVREVLAEETEVPAEVVPQVLFNTQGPTTFHDDLLAKLETE